MRGTLLASLADIHVGSTAALCPEKWTLHDGNVFTPNPVQEIIRNHYLETWERIDKQRKGRRLIVALDGDATENRHHDTTQLITARVDEMEAMAVSVIREGLNIAHFNPRKGDILRLITGTNAHDGQGAESLERVARALTGYTGDKRQTLDYWPVSIDGVIFNIAHKPGSGPGTRNWVRGNAFQAWLRSLYLDALETKKPVPRYVIRAHEHRYMERVVHSLTGEVVLQGFILAPFKVKDEYVYTLAPEAFTSIGALTVEVDPDGASRAACWRIPVEQDKLEAL